ncbi:MAG: glycosyltransferase family 2 protein [Syntrophobacteraceae bacterium]
MIREPDLNDPTNPLVSVLVYDYFGEHLGRCFDRILNQDLLNNLEVIFIDNASSDGSWEIALEYARRYRGIITLKRNNRNGGRDNYKQARRMAKGKYCVKLTGDDAFSPEYVKNCVKAMEENPLASFVMVGRKVENIPDRPNIKDKPLVSVLIHNYNYGRYLRQCLDSVLNQTYDNVEIVFSDNASTDDSWDIAVDYARRYPRQMVLIRNRKNFGPGPNLENCYAHIKGKYFCVLCSDDEFAPEFIHRCVESLEANPEAGYAMTHRAIIDEKGARTEEPPFYNQSCVIPGPEQAAVYMMAAVNPSISQIMYIKTKIEGKLPVENILSRWYAQRLLDFNLCCEHPMVYINEPLLLNRVHSQSDSSHISGNLMEIFGQYILPHQFAEISLRGSDMNGVRERLPMALEKVGRLCLRYCVLALSAGDEPCARRYFHLAAAILPEIAEETVFRKIGEYWDAEDGEKTGIVEALRTTANLTHRIVSYDPPAGSARIVWN